MQGALVGDTAADQYGIETGQVKRDAMMYALGDEQQVPDRIEERDGALDRSHGDGCVLDGGASSQRNQRRPCNLQRRRRRREIHAPASGGCPIIMAWPKDCQVSTFTAGASTMIFGLTVLQAHESP